MYDTIRYDTRCYFNVRSKADRRVPDRQTDRRTDRQTLGHSIYRASIASRSKNENRLRLDKNMAMSLWPHFLGPRCIGYSNLGLVVSYYLDLLSTLQAAANILKQLYRFFIVFLRTAV